MRTVIALALESVHSAQARRAFMLVDVISSEAYIYLLIMIS